MAIFVQVAVEYGALASRNSGGNSLERAIRDLVQFVSSEWVLVGLGILVAIYLLSKLF